MTPRVPRALRIAAIALGALLLAWLLFAWLAFEPLLKWALPRHFAQHGGYVLSLGRASLHPFRLAASVSDVALREPGGAPLLTLGRLGLDFDAASLFKRAWSFDEVRVEAPVVTLALRPDGRLNWLDLAAALADPQAEPAPPGSAPPRVLVQRLAVTDGVLDLTDHHVSGGFHTRAEALSLELHRLSTLPDDRGEHTLSAQTGLGATVRWRGEFALNPVQASGEVRVEGLQLERLWPYLQASLRMQPPQGEAGVVFGYRASYAQGRLDAALERVQARLAGLVLRSAGAAEPALALDALTLAGGRLDLATRRVAFERVQVGPGRAALRRDGDGRLDVQGWLREAAPGSAPQGTPPAASASTPASAPAPASTPASTPASGAAPAAAAPPTAASAAGPWQLRVDQLAVHDVGLRFTDEGFTAPLTAAVAKARLALALDARIGGGEPVTFDVQKLAAGVEQLTVTAQGEREPWFTLAAAELDEARIASGGRGLAAGVLALRGGRLRVERDAAGRIALAERLARRAAAAAPESAQARTAQRAAMPQPARTATREPRPAAAHEAATAAPASAPAWPLRLQALRLSDFAVAFKDAAVQPPMAITLTDVQAEATEITHDSNAPIPVSLALRVDRGGRFEAKGRVVPGAPAADLQLALADLSLVPAQPYVAQATTLKLAGGRAATQGRLRVDPQGWRYDGSVDVRGVRLDEADSGERFLGWERLHSPRVVADARGTRIGELRAEGLNAKLVIERDRSVNVAQVLRPAAARPASPKPDKAPAAPARGGAAPGEKETPYAFTLDRLRIAGGSVDFADLSLALPFGTRIHELQGQLVGLTTRGSAPAQLELDGKVDDFGLARAAGQLRLFDPTAYTDLKVVFRNVEMSHLTPYSATFAGRRIASGKLSLDLEYKVQDRKLAGENQVVMDQLTLGERVQSPSALDLPLDLAVAILQDANGRIDLGLPVSGSLDDPQFSYGALIGKAIANLLTRIVTAPFRALGALFGGGAGGQAMESVGFDPGRSELLPPEREGLARLAGALARRPALALSVQPRFDPQADAQALRERAVRAAVARAMGRTVADGEEPGPLGLADAATRTAVERLYTQRFGSAELQALRRRLEQANPGTPADGAAAQALSRLGSLLRPAPPPLSADEATRLRGADLHALMLQRLVQAQPVEEAALRTLAEARGQAIQGELLARGVGRERLQVAPPQPAAQGDARVVRSTLGLAASGASVAATRPDGAGAPSGATPAPAATPR